MRIWKMIEDTFFPKVTTFYVLQPGKSHWVKDVGVAIPIGEMENELRTEETILRLKKSKVLLPKFPCIPVKTRWGMKEISFAYMPDYRNVHPLKTDFVDGDFNIVPESYDIAYLRGTLRTYQDIKFKVESLWEKYAPFIIVIVVVVVMGIFIRMTSDAFTKMVDSVMAIESKVTGIDSNLDKLGEITGGAKRPPQP